MPLDATYHRSTGVSQSSTNSWGPLAPMILIVSVTTLPSFLRVNMNLTLIDSADLFELSMELEWNL